MKYGAIIVNQEIGHNEYKIKRFKEEATSLDISLTTFVNNGTLAYIDSTGAIKVNIPKCDFVLYLDKDIYLARLLEKAGFRLFNSADFIKMCDDKILTYIYCSKKGIRMPKTFAGPLFYSNELIEENFKFLDQVVKELGLPIIVKKVYGSLGEGVYKVNSKEELICLYAKIAREPVLFQEDIGESFGRSVRVLIIDGKVFGAFERYNSQDFRSNYSILASSREMNNPKYLEFGQHIADEFNILYAGIDLLFGKNDTPILCEINSNAFFEEFEKVTGKNAAKAFLEMVISHL